MDKLGSPIPRGETSRSRDHLGSTRITLHDNGSVQSVFNYSPTGKIITNTQGENSPYKFTGQECDEETELHNFRAMIYDDAFGGFILWLRSWLLLVMPSGRVNPYRILVKDFVNKSVLLVDPARPIASKVMF